jgi:hypothetical protein
LTKNGDQYLKIGRNSFTISLLQTGHFQKWRENYFGNLVKNLSSCTLAPLLYSPMEHTYQQEKRTLRFSELELFLKNPDHPAPLLSVRISFLSPPPTHGFFPVAAMPRMQASQPSAPGPLASQSENSYHAALPPIRKEFRFRALPNMYKTFRGREFRRHPFRPYRHFISWTETYSKIPNDEALHSKFAWPPKLLPTNLPPGSPL